MQIICQNGQLDFTFTESHIESSVLWERHCHARYEIIAVLEGDVNVILEGRSYRLTQHQSIIIPPLIYHTVTANQQGVYRRVTALFDMTAVPAVLRSAFQQKVDERVLFPSHQMDEITLLGEGEDAGFYEPLIQSLMVRLFYSAVLAKPSQGENETVEVDTFLQRVTQYVDEHLCEKISLDDLAAHTARSKSSLCHLFEEKMGISPKQYILQKKMALANKLIRDGMPPTSVAMQIGYQSYSTFYRVYGKHFQTCPSMESAGGSKD